MPETVLTARDGAVLTITFNRPEKLNALDASVHAGLREALSEAAEPEVRAVVLTGAGRGFCVGQDLTEFAGTPDIAAALRERYHPNVLAIRAGLVDSEQLRLGIVLMPETHQDATRTRLEGILAQVARAG